IPPRGQFSLPTAGAAAATSVGWVQVNPALNSAPPSGVTLVSYTNQQGITVSQMSIPASAAGSAYRTYIEASGASGQIGSMRTGIAVCNPSNAPVTLQFDLRNLDGTPTGLSTTLTLPANGQIARFIDEFIPQIPI